MGPPRIPPPPPSLAAIRLSSPITVCWSSIQFWHWRPPARACRPTRPRSNIGSPFHTPWRLDWPSQLHGNVRGTSIDSTPDAPPLWPHLEVREARRDSPTDLPIFLGEIIRNLCCPRHLQRRLVCAASRVCSTYPNSYRRTAETSAETIQSTGSANRCLSGLRFILRFLRVDFILPHLAISRQNSKVDCPGFGTAVPALRLRAR